MDADTLVTGLAIDHFHRFSAGTQSLGGLTAPWNTFAVWNVEMLGRTGFLPISDGVSASASWAILLNLKTGSHLPAYPTTPLLSLSLPLFLFYPFPLFFVVIKFRCSPKHSRSRVGTTPTRDGKVPPLDEEDAGVEEVAAIALLQTLFPGRTEAKLVRIDADSYSWDVDFSCPKRQEQHVQKMHSKMLRPKYAEHCALARWFSLMMQNLSLLPPPTHTHRPIHSLTHHTLTPPVACFI
jgi:hypothetical protein